MSLITELASKFLIEVISKGNVELLDELLHPEYFFKSQLTDQDLDWYSLSSWTGEYVDRNPNLAKKYGLDHNLVIPPGIEQAKIRLQGGNQIFQPDRSEYNIHHILDQEEIVIIIYTAEFVHSNYYFNIAPTLKKIKYNGCHIFYFKNDKIIKVKPLVDTYEIIKKIGGFILKEGDEEQINLYLNTLREQKLIP